MMMTKYVVGVSTTQRLRGLTIPVMVVGKADSEGTLSSKQCMIPDIVFAIAEWFKIPDAATSEFEKVFNMAIHLNDDNEADHIEIWTDNVSSIQYREKDMYELLALLFRGGLIE